MMKPSLTEVTSASINVILFICFNPCVSKGFINGSQLQQSGNGESQADEFQRGLRIVEAI